VRGGAVEKMGQLKKQAKLPGMDDPSTTSGGKKKKREMKRPPGGELRAVFVLNPLVGQKIRQRPECEGGLREWSGGRKELGRMGRLPTDYPGVGGGGGGGLTSRKVVGKGTEKSHSSKHLTRS